MTDLINYDAAEKDQSRSRSFFGYKDQAYHKRSIGHHPKITIAKSHFEREASGLKFDEAILGGKSQDNSALLAQKKNKSNATEE